MPQDVELAAITRSGQPVAGGGGAVFPGVDVDESALAPSAFTTDNAVLCQLEGSLTWLRAAELAERLAADGCTVGGDQICWSVAYSELPDPKPALAATSDDLAEWAADKDLPRQWYVIDIEVKDSVSLRLISRSEATLYIARSAGGEDSYLWISQSSLEAVISAGQECPTTRGAILYSIKFVDIGDDIKPVKEDGSIETESGKLMTWFTTRREALLASSTTQAVEVNQAVISEMTRNILLSALRVYARTYERIYDQPLRLMPERKLSDSLIISAVRVERCITKLAALRSSLRASGSKRLLGLLNDFFAGLPESLGFAQSQRARLVPRAPSMTGFLAGFFGRKPEVREIITAVNALRVTCGLSSQQASCDAVLSGVDRAVVRRESVRRP